MRVYHLSPFTWAGTEEIMWIHLEKKKKGVKNPWFSPTPNPQSKEQARIARISFPKYWGAHSLSRSPPAVSSLELNPECAAYGHSTRGAVPDDLGPGAEETNALPNVFPFWIIKSYNHFFNKFFVIWISIVCDCDLSGPQRTVQAC